MLILAFAVFAIGQNLYVDAASTERISGDSVDTVTEEDVKTVDYEIDVPEACKGLNYCMIKPDDSPQDEINKFFEYEEMLLHEPAQFDEKLRRKRMLSGDEYISPCKSIIRYGKMQAVKKINKWHLVISNGTNDDYVIEICLNPETPCENPKTHTYERHCKQKMRIVQVEIMKNNNEKKLIDISLPNGCSCEVNFNLVEP